MLLPGFVAAGIFHTLTSHPKASEFERLIQALIFTTILKLIAILLKGGFLKIGWLFSIGRWSPDLEIGWSIALAVPLGLAFAWFANTDYLHRMARECGLAHERRIRLSGTGRSYGTNAG